MRRILILFFLLPFFTLNAQLPFDWVNPVQHELKLSGTFGELRGGHFHLGLDIKSSSGRAGDPVFSIGDGIVHRIRVQSGGYGNSVYLRHPQGYISVYGHLKNRTVFLDSLIAAHQKLKESFEVDLYLDSLNIEIQGGEQIGNMGSTGYSFGPHLHFEIREAESEMLLNPHVMGFDIKDDVQPDLKAIRFYFMSPEGRIYHKVSKRINSNKSSIALDTFELGAWRCGIGLQTFDKMNVVPNKNGIHEIAVNVDGLPIYNFQMDSLFFEQSNFINVVKDFDAYQQNKELWYKCFLPSNLTENKNIVTSTNQGFVELYSEKPRHVKIVISDFEGNEKRIEFWLKRSSEMIEQNFPPHNYRLLQKEPNIVQFEKAILECPERTFFKDEFVQITEIQKQNQSLSNTYLIKGGEESFNGHCNFHIDISAIDSNKLDKLILIGCLNNDWVNFGGRLNDGYFSTKLDRFGEYTLCMDSIAPEIKVGRFPERMKNGEKIIFNAVDNYEAKGQASEISYRATINGEWVNMSYDLRKYKLAYVINNLRAGEHKFKLICSDPVGNSSVFEKTFIIE